MESPSDWRTWICFIFTDNSPETQALPDDLLRSRIAYDADRVKADRDKYAAALDQIASWREGAEVSGSFDEPGSARIAREALLGREY